MSLLEEVITPRKELPPLLLKLSERRAEKLDYLGVSYGLTAQLLKWVGLTWSKGVGLNLLEVFKNKSVFNHNRFWKKAGYIPVYLRQTPVSTTQSLFHVFVVVAFCLLHCCNYWPVRLCLEWPYRRALLRDAEGAKYRWKPGAEPVAFCLLERWTCLHCLRRTGVLKLVRLLKNNSSSPFSDFRRRFLSLLSYQFSNFHPSLALSILQNKKSKENTSSKSPLFKTPWSDFSSEDLTPIWLVSHHNSSQQLRVGGSLQPLRPQTSGAVFEEHGGLPPHYGPGPNGGTRVLPQAARWYVSLSSAVCTFPSTFCMTGILPMQPTPLFKTLTGWCPLCSRRCCWESDCSISLWISWKRKLSFQAHSSWASSTASSVNLCKWVANY